MLILSKLCFVQLFFYKYFKEKKRREPEHKKQTEDEEEAEDAAIDSFEADVDEAEIETALLEALEKKENKQILERDEENKVRLCLVIIGMIMPSDNVILLS